MWAVLVVAGLTVLPLVAWGVRNWQTFGVVQPLAPRYANDPGEVNPAGFQRWYRTWAVEFASTEDVYWNYDGSAIDVGDLPDRAFDTGGAGGGDRGVAGGATTRQTTGTPELDARFDAIARERVRGGSAAVLCCAAGGAGGQYGSAAADGDAAGAAGLVAVPSALKPGRSCLRLGFAGLNLGYFALAGDGAGAGRSFGGGRRDVLVWAMLATVGLRVMLLLTVDNSEARGIRWSFFRC